jgi:hypothetical protein
MVVCGMNQRGQTIDKWSHLMGCWLSVQEPQSSAKQEVAKMRCALWFRSEAMQQGRTDGGMKGGATGAGVAKPAWG